MSGICFSLPSTNVRTFAPCTIDGVPDAISAFPPLEPIAAQGDVVLLRSGLDRYALFEAGPNGQPNRTRALAEDLRTPQFCGPDTVVFGIAGGPRLVMFLTDPDRDQPRQTPQGFLEGTRVLGRSGIVPIEQLAAGDLIWTIDHGMQAIRWIVRKHFTIDPATEALRPLRIERDSFAKGCPTDTVFVLPDHILGSRDMPVDLPDKPDARAFTAQYLLDGDRVRRMIERDTFEVFSLGLEVTDIIYASGLMLEATQPKAVRKTAPSAVTLRFKRVFPELEDVIVVPEPDTTHLTRDRYSTG